jgi:hypothetical protein
VIECDDVDRAGIGVGLQRDESLFIADDAHLSCAARGRNATARECQVGRAIQPRHRTLMKVE